MDVFKALHRKYKDLRHQSHELQIIEKATNVKQVLLKLPKIRNEFGQKSPSFHGAILLNKLDLNLRAITIVIFKRTLTIFYF